jgi:hypothetical protein
MKVRLLVLAGLAVLIGAGVLWFRANFELVEVKEWVGPSGEARVRPFLAAQRFAERMGMKVGEIRAQPELDALPVQGVLILPNRRESLPPARLASLAQWVDRGGHLVVEAEAHGADDPLLDLLGVKRSAVEITAKPLAVRVPGKERPLAAQLATPTGIDTAASDVRLRAGTSLVSFARGRGLVSAATSLHFARNGAIGSLDHAELLWTVLSLTSGREPLLAPRFQLHVYSRVERLSLWGFLKEHAAPALAASGLLLALWLWSIAPRFGPVAPDAPPGRRRLLDHLRASGRYFWARGLRARLVLAARDAALRRIARAQPDFAAAGNAERAQRLASLTHSTPEESGRFLSAGGAMRGAEFIRLTQHAQRVHSALDKGQPQ